MSSSNKKTIVSQEIVSKYFVSKNMDDSLSDFKETKKTNQGPKTKLKPKKTKKIKGQKDIRSVLKGKNNLVEYSKQFNNVCRKSGINIDSEELQLAIAISNSIKEEQGFSGEAVTTTQRSNKIRSTLQEYGFKVPDIKVSNKRMRIKKDSKLLLMSKENKDDIIREKYSMVITRHVAQNSNFTKSKSDYYKKATSITYDKLKNLDCFYVPDLIEQTSNTVGSLLRDWSEIPGRPSSPVKNKVNFNIFDCNLSLDKLDIILSGTFEIVREIYKANKSDISDESANITIEDVIVIGECNQDNTFKDDSTHKSNKYLMEDEKNSNNTSNQYQTINYENSKNHSTFSKARSVSPDLFDDDTIISNRTLIKLDETNDVVIIDDKLSPKDTTTGSNDKSKNSIIVNDTIDLTQNKPEKEINVRLDLTQSSDSDDTLPYVDVGQKPSTDLLSNKKVFDDYTFRHSDSSENGPDIDLTQSSGEPENNEQQGTGDISSHGASHWDKNNYKQSNNDPNTSLSMNLDDIDVYNERNSIHSEYTVMKSMYIENHVINIDTDDKNTDLDNNHINLIEDVPINISQNCSDDKFKHLDKISDIIHSNVDIKTNKDSKVFKRNPSNLSLASETSETEIFEISDEEFNYSVNKSILVDLKYDSGNHYVDYDGTSMIDRELSNIKTKTDIIQDDSLPAVYIPSIKTPKLPSRDLILEATTAREYSPRKDSSTIIAIEENNVDYNETYKTDISMNDSLPFVEIPSQKITQKSVKKKNTQDFDFTNENKNIDTIKLCNNETDCKLDGNSHCFDKKTLEITPMKGNNSLINNIDTVVTPKNSLYVIKTNDVTPMLDYGALSTPERNSELDKYGLKPFKRKRAIQLLTHLYNQTHPIVEYDKDQPVIKRPKLDTNNSKKNNLNKPNITIEKENTPSHSKSQSDDIESVTVESRKNLADALESSKEYDDYNVLDPDLAFNLIGDVLQENVLNTENNGESAIYVITNPPVSASIDCDPEEWVFQKREKAKLQTCRVPLQVAFHNYVSSRRYLREAILRYEPIDIQTIHKDLVGYGHRYDPKDLLKFLDKKCITVKTGENNARNKKSRS